MTKTFPFIEKYLKMKDKIKIGLFTIEYSFENDNDIDFLVFHDMKENGKINLIKGLWNDSVDIIELEGKITKSQLSEYNELLNDLYNTFRKIHPLKSCNYCGTLSEKLTQNCSVCGKNFC